ncbi:hypothetical protein CC80DRAFT_598750 [Byssothecium circinans]|uniref:Endonuclease/exonuclease/phosphatase domain-containing protein n=1 Tax=Byssothecium circinans TaxID=147558 RepID=A0A6A5TBL5_9PLEO|nr:hypothetical protein CC80DRAFT_598750 [Byssothecium circinans]
MFPTPLVLALLASPQFVSPFCFHPNATQNTDTTHAPCSNSSSDPLRFVCCAIARPNPFGGDFARGLTADRCLPNGLCQNSALVKGTNITTYFQEECTERYWNNANCPSFCINGSDGNNNRKMTPCDGTPSSERWCCGPSDDCCRSKTDPRVQLVPEVPKLLIIGDINLGSFYPNILRSNLYWRDADHASLEGLDIGTWDWSWWWNRHSLAGVWRDRLCPPIMEEEPKLI